MAPIIAILLDEPLLLLFVVAAFGYVLGRVSIFGFRLGVAAVLFVGLGVGALDEALQLPEIVHLLGLVLFVYTIGLSSGEHFFASLGRKGLRDNTLVLGMLLLAAALAAVLALVLGLSTPLTAGVYCGSLTNTPALAAVMQTIRQEAARGGADPTAAVAVPVIGYSLAYPVGVLGMIAVMAIARRLGRIDDAAEAARAAAQGMGGVVAGRLTNRVVRVLNPLAVGLSTAELAEHSGITIVFGRLRRGEHTMLVAGETRLEREDLISVIGTPDQVERMTAFLGESCTVPAQLSGEDLDHRSLFVSSPDVAGLSLAELDLPRRFGAIITRLRRGDITIVPRGDTVLEPGDRVRIVTRSDRVEAVARFLGDSYREVSEIDVLSLGLGIALGLLLGMVPLTLPGGIRLTLGLAGGPLVVSLVLGALRRTGPVLWTIPYGANLTLRQFGLILFLAGVGTRSGYSFASTLAGGEALPPLLAALAITVLTGAATLWIGYALLKIPMGQLMGMLAALQTQPALLAYSLEQTRNNLPNIGYATVYPLAMIAKIVIAQILLTLP